MGLLTAVHVGDALDHNAHQTEDQDPGIQIDIEYLHSLQVADRIPQWRQVCRELSERNAS
ncbi:MAG: hypothetical protein P8X90_32340 [Desulfobacterales bacterium]